MFIVPFGGVGVFAIVESASSGEIELIFFGLLFLCVTLPFLYWIINGFSIHRLSVQHSIDLLVFDSTFRGRRWRVREKRLSESLYLRYSTWTTTSTDEDGNTSTHRHHAYNVHGHSVEEGEWELDISRMMTRFDHPKNKAGEIAKSMGIEFRLESE